MKITIDARGKEQQVLAREGLLKGGRVLASEHAKRRQIWAPDGPGPISENTI